MPSPMLSLRAPFVLGLLCLSFCFPAAQVFAEEEVPGLMPLDIPPPPDDIRPFDDSIEEPQITIRREERGTVEEYRVGGQLYMLKITPAVGAPYYLIDRTGGGQFEAFSPNRDTNVTVPMWVIDTF